MVVLLQVSVFYIQVLRSDKLPLPFSLNVFSLFLYSLGMGSLIPIVFVITSETSFFMYHSVKMFPCILADDADIHRKLSGVSFGKISPLCG